MFDILVVDDDKNTRFMLRELLEYRSRYRRYNDAETRRIRVYERITNFLQ